jgi:hypothetical protein
MRNPPEKILYYQGNEFGESQNPTTPELVASCICDTHIPGLFYENTVARDLLRS